MTPLRTLLRGGPSAVKASYLSFGGTGGGYNVGPFWTREPSSMLGESPIGHHEMIGSSFEDYVGKAYKENGTVFACIQARAMPFSEARFQYQRLTNGRPGELWGDTSLSLLESPWPNGTTGELLMRMEQDASLAGNSYWTPRNGRLRRLRPDWVTIVSGVPDEPDASPFHIDAEVLGYIYHPKVYRGTRPDPVLLTPAQVVHYSPTPDPTAQWRGMSWLTPVLAEIDGDKAAMKHKLMFFKNGATSNLAVTYDASITPEVFTQYVKMFNESHTGTEKAYKTMHFGGGADPKMVGPDMKQLDFKVTQGHGETRIAAAAGVGAIIARFSEGMQGSSLNQGNYGAAKRQFADMTLRPLWRMAAGSLAKPSVVGVPSGSRLWYDDRDIEFLKEDAKDAADIFAVQANTIRTLTDGGYDATSVVAAVNAMNPTLLRHTGLLSVQLQEPGAIAPAPTPS